MKICFVLPRYVRTAVGGYKIVFEYANRLCKRGHRVCIVFINKDTFKQYRMHKVVGVLASNIITQIEPRWFPLDSRVKKVSGRGPSANSEIQKSDVIIATASDTVSYVWEKAKNKKTVYFIQDYETWRMKEKALQETFNELDMNIVISGWLKRKVDQYAKTESILIPNSINTEQFQCKVQYSERQNHSVAFLYHEGERKGIQYTLQVVERLKYRYKDLKVYAFGVFSNHGNLPNYINYTYRATPEQIEEICNSVRVFISSSIGEGFGLTGLEAMACGAVLVSTDYGAIHEYAEDGFNSLLSPVKDIDRLEENVVRVFGDEELGKILSEKGNITAKNHSWEHAVDKFEDVLETLIKV